MPPQAKPGPRAEYGDPLRRLRRADGEEIRIAVNRLNGIPYVDIRHWQADGWGRFKPTDQHVTLRRHELPLAIAALHEATPQLGAVPVTRPLSAEDGKARRQLDAVRAALAEIKQAVRQSLEAGNSTAADEALDDLIIALIDPTGTRPC